MLTQLGGMTVKDCTDAVALFHRTFGMGYAHRPTVDITPETMALRHRLMAEENDEYLEAAERGDMTEVADALGDMLYILCGTMLSHGMQDVMADVFSAIQESNMSKLGADGKSIYREDGKVMKGPGYFRPDIAGVLERAGVQIPTPASE